MSDKLVPDSNAKDKDKQTRKELSRLIGSAVRRIREASVDQYDRANMRMVQLMGAHTQMIIASLIRGVLDELEVDRKIASEIERSIKRAEYIKAHDLMVQVLDLRKIPTSSQE
jgi:hypothetical protein